MQAFADRLATVLLVSGMALGQAPVRSIQFADQFPLSSVQAAINALPDGGGTVYLGCGGTYGIPSNIPSGVILRSTCSARTNAFGQYTTTLVTPSSWAIGPATGIGIIGINISLGDSGNLILNNIAQSYFDMSVICVIGSPCVNPIGTAGHTVFDRFDYLNITTGGPIGMQLSGTRGGYVTDNDFRTLIINMTRSKLGAITEALGFTQNCDSNHFGTVHLFFTNVDAGNGIVFNDSATPTIDTAADNEVFDLVDITSGRPLRGTAYTVNKSDGNKWTEGFGQGGFTNAVLAESTTHYVRIQLEGGGLAFGMNGIGSRSGGTTQYYLPIPPVYSGSFGTTLNATTGTYQSVKGTAGCTTPASMGAVCATPVTVTWPAAFSDTNYSAVCAGVTPINPVSAPFVGTKSNRSITVNYFAITANAASWATIDCIAVHD